MVFFFIFIPLLLFNPVTVKFLKGFKTPVEGKKSSVNYEEIYLFNKSGFYSVIDKTLGERRTVRIIL